MADLRIHDWDVHQTYRADRGQPPWIKVHRSLMRNIKWVGLDDNERGQLVAIWLLAADNNGVIPADSKIIQKFCFMSSEPNLNKFIDLGFIDKDGVNMTSSSCHDGVKLASGRGQNDATVTPQNRIETEKNRIETDGADALPLSSEKGKTKNRPTKTAIPDDFSVSPSVIEWYQKNGYTEDINKHLENFIDQCRAKGYTYIDHDAAFKNSVRKDWAGLRREQLPDGHGMKQPEVARKQPLRII